MRACYCITVFDLLLPASNSKNRESQQLKFFGIFVLLLLSCFYTFIQMNCEFFSITAVRERITGLSYRQCHIAMHK